MAIGGAAAADVAGTRTELSIPGSPGRAPPADEAAPGTGTKPAPIAFAMARWVCVLLIALATGLRSKSDRPWPWEEHPASSPEELQELLRTVLAQTNSAEVRVEEPGDAEMQERTLRQRIASIRKDWQSASATACHQQLGRLMNSLTLECGGLQPKADWLLDYYVPALPNKTCADSVSDIFALGNELVETLRVSRDAVASVDVAAETLRRYQALSFLRSWLVKLTKTFQYALLWAGFWDGDPENRTTQTALSNFAKAIEHATVHPNSFLGRAIEASQNLDGCYKDPQTSALAGNMWSIASMSFVLGMRERAQGTVIALVNKQIRGERNLSESVLTTHEIPTVGLAAWGLGYWSPKVLVLDLMGTCDQTSPALQKRLLARLPSWARSMTHWSSEAFAMRSRLRWQCIDCSGACSLDEALAEHVGKLVKAKAEQDRKDQELREVVGCHLVDAAQTSLRTELSLGIRLTHSLIARHLSQKTNYDAYERLTGLHELVEQWQGQLSKAELANRPQRRVEVEQLLRQNADPSAPNRFRGTALISAAEEGLQEVVKAMVKAGAQLEARDERGNTALLSAAYFGHLKVVGVMVKAGARLEARDEDGATALTIASFSGHLEVVEALVKAGAQLEAHNDRGRTALMTASYTGHLKVVEVLVKAGAQLEACNDIGNTALMCAAQEGHYEVVEVLVKAGARLEARGEVGATALTIASFSGHLEVVEALVKAGAQLEAHNDRGRTALMTASYTGHLKVVEVLVKAGAQLEARNDIGNTALMCAAQEGHYEVVEVLVKAGAQLETRNERGFTALMLASYKGHLKVAEVLRKAGAAGP
eukprot:s1725_g1.t1